MKKILLSYLIGFSMLLACQNKKENTEKKEAEPTAQAESESEKKESAKAPTKKTPSKKSEKPSTPTELNSLENVSNKLVTIAINGQYLGIYADEKNDKLRVAPKDELLSYQWKLIPATEDGLPYYYFSTEAKGETQVLTKVNLEDATGNMVTYYSLVSKGEVEAGMQMWELHAYKENSKNLFTINNVFLGNMALLTYENKKLDLVHKEPIARSQIWTITPTE